MKYDFLTENTLKDIVFNQLEISKPNYFFVSRNIKKQNIYEKGISVSELFTLNSIGIVTSKDEILINSSKEELIKNVSEYYSINADINLIKKISYRPFDGKFIYYDVKIIERARYKVMKHFLEGNNFGLVTARSNKSNTCDHFYISNNLMETKCGERTTQSAIFPLYLYPDNKGQQTIDQTTERTPNLNPEIVKQIAEQLGLTFVPDHELCHAELVSASRQTLKQVQGDKTVFTPLDLLDYIYAVLHSPTYREKYKEFLKIDFPRVPYPKDAATFWQLVQLGGQIRQIHLLESPIVEKYITGYPEDGDNVVRKPRFVIANDSEAIPTNETASCLAVTGKVFINDTQYFSNVPEVAWNFYIGGYQPAQKWLKDRKDRKLEFDDILHYQKIIVALSETDRLMKEIDAIEIE